MASTTEQHNLPDSDDGASYFAGSFNSQTETSSSVAGPGRLLGKFYSIVGRQVEKGAGVAAARMGYGPQATAEEIRRLLQNGNTKKLSVQRRIKSFGTRLVTYAKSDVSSTQESALDEIIRLSCEDEYSRRVLKESGVRTIGLLSSNPRIWYNMPKPIQTMAERAIIALNDENASIKNLVWSLRSTTILKSWPYIRKTLRGYLLHPNFSFVVIRHIRRTGVNTTPFTSANVARLIAENMQDSAPFTEWPEVDEVLSQLDTRALGTIVSNVQDRYDVIFGYADRLPKMFNSAPMQEWFNRIESNIDIKSNSVDVLIRSFASFYVVASLMKERHQTTVTSSPSIDPILQRIYRRISSRANEALSTICRSSFHNSLRGDRQVAEACRTLAELVNNGAGPDQEEALINTRIALCADRYSRRSMISALSGTTSSFTAQCIALLSDTEEFCRPPDCLGRAAPSRICQMHADIHSWKIYRHCDENGNIIHLMRQYETCDGECGGSEEYVAVIDPSDTISLLVSREEVVDHTKHHAFVAGTMTKGRKAYAFSVRDQNDLEFFGHGPSIQKAKFYRRDLNGKAEMTGHFPTDKALYVPVLKYDPDAYYLCQHYAAKKEREGLGIQPTGPFFWKFNRDLPTEEQYYDAEEGSELSAVGDDDSDEEWFMAEEGQEDAVVP